MQIERFIQWSREPDPTFLRELAEFNARYEGPDIFVVWNPNIIAWHDQRPTRQDPRWQIWGELRDVSHTDASNKLYKTDRWFPDLGYWGRKIQTWQHDDGSYADLANLLEVAAQADTWRNRRFYEDHIADPYEREEAAKVSSRNDLIRDAGNYYRDLDRLLVAPGSKDGAADWRWRNR